MIQINDKVRIKPNMETSYLNESMIKFIEENKNKVFKVERTDFTSVKLYKIGFWISRSLLEEV